MQLLVGFVINFLLKNVLKFCYNLFTLLYIWYLNISVEVV